MSSYRDYIVEARARGITLQIDADGDLEIGGEYTDKFIEWAKRRKRANWLPNFPLVSHTKTKPQPSRKSSTSTNLNPARPTTPLTTGVTAT